MIWYTVEGNGAYSNNIERVSFNYKQVNKMIDINNSVIKTVLNNNIHMILYVEKNAYVPQQPVNYQK